MKKYIKSIMATLLAIMSQQLLAANTVTTVNQVTEAVTVSADVDYTITSTTPFATTGSVNITNTDHAVVIIKNIKPSVVKSRWLASYVKINGAKAVDGSNCQVKMYGYGAIILPYASNIKPLTVYSEKNFEGTAVNDFGLEHTGGFMNTLTEAKLNNQIRSFKLKRGYMVTFSTRAGGRGYSRCFIADKADLEISSLPLLLDQKISSYRVFHWYNAKKAGLASDTRFISNDALNSSWCYSWGTGESRLPDTECVPNHIYEDWPSPASCGNVTYSCHMKTNNEPGNSADDHPQDVATVLANWENLMRTGLRLCSESSHDGSMNHLKAFIDSIDARGWRCDILDLHCYWQSGTFNNLNWYSSNYGNGRPIWISEWVWGASWNHNGFWGNVSDAGSLSAANQQTLYNGTKPILDVLNGNSKVERYAYWNSEAAGTHIYDGGVSGGLTTLGKYYANMGEGLGYNPANEFIPTLPPMKNTGALSIAYDKDARTATLKWRDYNGEYNQSMVIQQQALGSTAWTDLKTVTQKEQETLYTETVEDCNDGTKFRIVIKVPSSNTGTATKTLTGNTVTARSATLEYGDAMTVIINDEPVQKYLGGNRLVNGDFSLGTTDWKAGDGNTICAPYFQVMPEGGIGNSPYLQAYGNKIATTSPQSILYNVPIESGKSYYLAGAGLNTRSVYQYFKTTGTASVTPLKFDNAASWSPQSATFYNNEGDRLGIYLTNCGGNAQFDDIMVCQLFDTPEEALADALAWEKKRVEAFVGYNTILPVLNARMDEAAAAATNANELEATLQQALDVLTSYKQLGNTIQDAGTIISMHFSAEEEVQKALDNYNAAIAPNSDFSLEGIQNAITGLMDNVSAALSYTIDNKTIKTPTFGTSSALSSTGWTTKAGTYTDGDQRTNTFAGKPCWKAWWAIATADAGDKTLAVKQQLTNLPEGFYSLECKGSTQHYCETDQHAFITYNGTDYNSPVLDLGNADITSFPQAQMWRTMATPFVYIKAGESATVGFMSSKQGAVDKTYIKYGDATNTGDNREGWWCATDFQFRYVPAISRQHQKGTWGTICMPYKIAIPKGVTLYTIAGRSNDGMHIFVQPVTDESAIVAGRAYIYYTTEENVMFIGAGDPVSSPTTAHVGLKGIFSNTTTKYGTLSAALVDGKWIYKPGTTIVPSNTGYIATFSTITKKFDVAPEGTVSMPLSGYVSDVLGDANDDGEVTMADALAIQAYFVGTEGVTINTTKADYNGDGKITIDDANCIINAVVK